MLFRKFILLIGDIFFLYLSLLLMLLIRFRNSFSISVWNSHVFPFTVVFIVWIVIFYIWDMYDLSFKKQRENFVNAMVMSIFIAMAMFYVASGTKISPKTNLLITFGIFTFFFFIWRLSSYKIFIKFRAFIKIAVIGIDFHTVEIIKRIKEKKESGYRVDYYTDIYNRRIDDQTIEEKIKIVDDLDKIFELAHNNSIDIVIVSSDHYSKIFEYLYKLSEAGVGVYHISTFWEEFSESIPIGVTNELWFLENIREDKKRLFQFTKRIFDIVIAIFISPIFLFLSVFITLIIKIEGSGPILIKQKRVGKHNKIFTLYKFRTMVKDAEQDGPQWATTNDKRITSVGRLLRAMRLDEIPQIYNVFKGDMSFVGPRPERPEFIKELNEKLPHYNFRHFSKPGLTGWAQIKVPYASSVEDSAKKLEYDLYYIKNRSLLLDIKILLRTVMIISKRQGL